MILLLLYSAFCATTHPHPDPPFHLCDTPTLAANSPYRSSLDNLLSSMSSHLPPNSSFYKPTNGTDHSDKVYGLFVCYAYSPQQECHKCVQPSSLPQTISRMCEYRYEATVWEENCLFRYSTRNFYGHLNLTGNILLYNQKNVSDSEPQRFRFRSLVNETLQNLTVLAASDPSYDMHSNGSTSFMEINTLYAFVQCSKDLSPADCRACLGTAIQQILDCYYFSRGARVLSRACFLRYELYDFVGGETAESHTNQNPAPGNGNKIEKWILAVITSVTGVLALSALGCCVFCLIRRNRAKGEGKVEMHRDNLELAHDGFVLQHNLDPQEFPFIEMKIIEEATDNFSDLNKLGEGGFGPVFKGILPDDGHQIAVKRLSINSEQGSEEFINEVLFIHKLQHVNLVKLLGFCVHKDEKLLIYEYMPNGSLDSFLFDSRKRAQLNWSTRINIINGVSRGMLYLHQDSRLKIIHRDLKPSNILLDAHMIPKISDFGMAKMFGGNDGEAKTAKVVGTYGYMAPEFAMDGLYSIKSDVFSFGVLLLEIITGRRNARFHLTKLGPSLLAYAWKLWNEGNGQELMDPLLGDTDCYAEEEFLRYMQIGLLCVQEDAYDRPTMPTVVQMLNRDTITLSQPERPSFTLGNMSNHGQTCLDNLSLNHFTLSDLVPR